MKLAKIYFNWFIFYKNVQKESSFKYKNCSATPPQLPTRGPNSQLLTSCWSLNLPCLNWRPRGSVKPISSHIFRIPFFEYEITCWNPLLIHFLLVSDYLWSTFQKVRKQSSLKVNQKKVFCKLHRIFRCRVIQTDPVKKIRQILLWIKNGFLRI